ncbi:MAG TPA: DnaJ domain-containing protein [Methylovirgula sp.]|nr:DnaJ domain-containing protein [Methylovirgula sp.]
MPYLLAGLLIFWLLLYGLRAFSRANPAQLARALRASGGGLTLILALVLLVRGRIDVAIVLGAVGSWLFARKPIFRRAAISRMRSAMIEMEVDSASGLIRGVILAGPDEGKPLDRMTWPQCEALYRLCFRDDPDGARLLETYFDRRFSGWRAAGDGGYDAWGHGAQAAARSGVMSEDEAYEVLGLHKGASRDDVVRSHRSLMKKLHPDRGGSTDLAARVNEAKDVLMRRHH